MKDWIEIYGIEFDFGIGSDKFLICFSGVIVNYYFYGDLFVKLCKGSVKFILSMQF